MEDEARKVMAANAEKIENFQEGLASLLNEARFEGMHDDEGKLIDAQVLDFYLGLAARYGDALEVSKVVFRRYTPSFTPTRGERGARAAGLATPEEGARAARLRRRRSA